jgi:threonine/homoserine/homoserine lactone efflux protein
MLRALHEAVAPIAAFVLAFVGSVPLAGPVSIIVVSRVARREPGVALRMAIGAAVAEGGYAGVAFWGYATFLAHHPLVGTIAHGVSALLLVGIGAHFVFWKGGGDGWKHARPRDQRRGSLLVGFLVSAFNPTLLVTWSVLVAMLDARGALSDRPAIAVPFGLCAAGGIVAWNAILVGSLMRLGGRIPHGVLTRVVRGMGIALVVIGAWTAVGFVREASHLAASA